MRTSVAVITASCLVGVGAISSLAAEWDTFKEVSSRYYYLDDQDISTISCKIDVPLLEESLRLVKQQLLPLQGKVSIEENLADFRLPLTAIN